MRIVRSLCLVAVVLIACRKTSAPPTIGVGDVPPPAELDQYVSGAGNIRLGMTEQEVDAALGKKSTRRQDAAARDGATDVAWDKIAGAHPGAAVGRFFDGKLTHIEFAPATTTMPRISADAARSLAESGSVVQRAVARTLRLSDVEAVTGSRGLRAQWSFSFHPPNRADVKSLWAWEVEPGGRALIVEEEQGLAGQPVVRDIKR